MVLEWLGQEKVRIKFELFCEDFSDHSRRNVYNTACKYMLPFIQTIILQFSWWIYRMQSDYISLLSVSVFMKKMAYKTYNEGMGR